MPHAYIAISHRSSILRAMTEGMPEVGLLRLSGHLLMSSLLLFEGPYPTHVYLI